MPKIKKIETIKKINNFAKENKYDVLKKIFNNNKECITRSNIDTLAILLSHPLLPKWLIQDFCSDREFVDALMLNTHKEELKPIADAVSELLKDVEMARYGYNLLVSISDEYLYKNFEKINHVTIRNSVIKRYVTSGLAHHKTKNIPLLSQVHQHELNNVLKDAIIQNENAMTQFMINTYIAEETKKEWFGISTGVNPHLLVEYLQNSEHSNRYKIPDFLTDEIYNSCIDVLFDLPENIEITEGTVNVAFEALHKLPMSKAADIDYVKRCHSEKSTITHKLYKSAIYDKVCKTTNSTDAMTLILDNHNDYSVDVLIYNKNAKNQLENYQKYLDEKMGEFIEYRKSKKIQFNGNYDCAIFLSISEHEKLKQIAKRRLVKDDDIIMKIINFCDSGELSSLFLNNPYIKNTDKYKRNYDGDAIPEIMLYFLKKFKTTKFSKENYVDKYIKGCILDTCTSINIRKNPSDCEKYNDIADVSSMPIINDKNVYDKIIDFIDNAKLKWRKDKTFKKEIEVGIETENEVNELFKKISDASKHAKIKCDIALCCPEIFKIVTIEQPDKDIKIGQSMKYEVRIQNFGKKQQENLKNSIKENCEGKSKEYVSEFLTEIKNMILQDDNEKYGKSISGNIIYVDKLYDLYQKAYNIIDEAKELYLEHEKNEIEKEQAD